MKISRYIIRVILGLSLVIVQSDCFSQSTGWSQKQDSWKATETLVKSYISTMELKGINSPSVNEKSVQDFIGLFTPNAKIYDEIILSYFEGDVENPYGSRFRELPDYLNQMKQFYPAGIMAQPVNMSYDFSQLNKHKVLVIMQKSLTGVSNSGYVVEVKDTIQIEVQLNDNFNLALINRITKIGSSVRITNDMDGDFIVDAEDKCPQIAGLKDFNGCLPPVKGQTYFTLMVSKSLSADAKLDAVGLSAMSYDALISSGSYMSDVSVDKGQTQYFGISLEYSKFLGKLKSIGFGTGISYVHFDSQLQLENFKVKYRSSDSYGTSYKRIISINSRYVETVKSDYIRIPLLIKAKTKVSGKIGVFADIGVGIDFALSSKSSSNGTFNYEAVYAYIGDELTFSSADASTDFVITGVQVQSLNGSNEATMEYFNEHNAAGFDVALNRSPDKIDKFKLKPGFTFEIRGGIAYDLSSTTSLLLAGSYINFSNSVNQPDLYQFTDKTGEVTSLVSGSKSLKWNAIGINIGISHMLK